MLFQDFYEGLRKQEVYVGTFPITQVSSDFEFGQVWSKYVCHDITPQLWRKLEGKRSIQGNSCNKDVTSR